MIDITFTLAYRKATVRQQDSDFCRYQVCAWSSSMTWVIRIGGVTWNPRAR